MKDFFKSFKRYARESFPNSYNKYKFYKTTNRKKRIKLVQIADLIINDMNINRNDIIMVHTSLKNIELIDANPDDLIFLFKMIIGKNGTLIMPTFAKNHYKILYDNLPYNIKSNFCSNGLINEYFRQMPDSIQSCHPLKSVSAWGKYAEFVTKDHYKSEYAFDKNSPFYKLFQLKGKIIGIGVGLSCFSFLHTIEDTNDQYFPVRYSDSIRKECIASNGETITGYFRHNLPEIARISSPYNISKHFNNEEMREFIKKGVPFFYADAENVYNKTLLLAKNGITMYKNV